MKKDKIPLNKQSIVLIGFMGVGKTTIGKLIANKLSREFIDVDAEIEKEYGMPTSKIFQVFGERAFREKEKMMSVSLAKQPLKVISLGGGAFKQDEIKNACLNHCLVIYLDISWDLWRERIYLLINSRPVLQNKSDKEIEDLFYSRKEVYSPHHLKISTDHLTPEEVAEKIINAIQ